MDIPAESKQATIVSAKRPTGIAVDPCDFEKSGLYLLFPDGRRIALTHERIHSFAQTFKSNLEQLPERIRGAAAFEPCPVCPERDQAVFCHALPPALAFVEELEGFNSYDRVGALYRGSGPGLVWIPDISMREALQFAAIMSLMSYCEVGRKYWKFFLGIHPLQDLHGLTARIHLNILWDCHGDRQKADQVLEKFAAEVNCTCRCQVDRLNLVCKSDVLTSAFVNIQNKIEYLAMCKGALLDEAFEDHLRDS